MQLLAHLRKSHGKASNETDSSPKLVTLKRRRVTEIKEADIPLALGRVAYTVSVEAYRKRTYIKRPEAEEQKYVGTFDNLSEESTAFEITTAAVEATMPVITEVQLEPVVSVIEKSTPESEAKANNNDIQNHVIPNTDLNTVSESLIEPENDSGLETDFKTLNTEKNKVTTTKEQEIKLVEHTVDTFKPAITPFNVNITKTLSPELTNLTLEQLVDTYAQVDQQSQLLKGLILLEARERFTSNNDFGKWVESVGTLCSDTRQTRTKYMNFARYFKDKSYDGISLTCCYEISAPINEDVADEVYHYALNKNLSVAQIRERIQTAKGLLPSKINEATEEISTLESLPPEDIARFKDQVLSDISGLAKPDAIRVLKECMKAISK